MVNAVKQKEWYSVEQCESDVKTLFVFGDNLAGFGDGGQAQVRPCVNSIGIPTKRLPAMTEDSFFSDQVDELVAVTEAIAKVKQEYMTGGYTKLVFPADGLGTGLARMDTKSPEVYNKMNYMIYMVFGIDYGVPTSSN